jgi:hypothetical protein
MKKFDFEELRNPEKILEWLSPYTSHEHLADIKKVSLEKYLAVAPDVYVMASMLRSIMLRAIEQKEFAELGEKEQVKPWSQLSEEEKISEAPLRKQYLKGLRAGHDSGMIELCNRIVLAARQDLDRYRLENPEYDPDLVVDGRDLPDVE